MLIPILLALAILAVAYGLHRRRGARLEQQKRELRHQRRQEQDAAWEEMLAQRPDPASARKR